MGINRHTETEGVEVVTVDYPPVNALPSDGWFALADAVTQAGRNPETRVVVLRAEGRGFNAGVDIKEMNADISSSSATARPARPRSASTPSSTRRP
ncbi:enoyl-CoA hydratase-related protein, partial [Nocardia sp. NPDC046763]|uniref:enoyl-CoA hydratase-related protein n=1 Tax=Nocardia sp. NPDC046763 TaxID=3155256 RepID=UPI00340D3F5E